MLISPTSAQLLTNYHHDQIDSTLTSVTSWVKFFFKYIFNRFSKCRSSPPTIQTNSNLTDAPEYLSQLLKDRRQLAALPTMFFHVERLLDQGKYSILFN